MQIIKYLSTAFILLSLYCGEGKPNLVKIRIGVPPRTNYLPVLIAAEKGIFKKNGLDVNIVLDEKVGELYAERKVDIICTGLTEPILFSSEGHSTQIIYRFSYSLANDIIVSNPNIKSIDSLRKKRVAFDGVNTSSHIFVQQLLSEKGISEGEYFAVNLPNSKVLEELEKGNIDAGHTSGISKSEIIKKGWNIIGRSSDVPDLLSDTLSVDSVFLKKNPTEINKIISSTIEAKNWFASNRSESISILSKLFKKKENEIEEELNGILFLTLAQNSQSLKTLDSETPKSIYSSDPSGAGGIAQGMNFNLSGKKGGLFTAGETIIQFLRERGQLYKMPSIQFIINDTFVKDQEIK